MLITAHELGHMIVAKLCGVKVHTFSIGFGRPLWSFQYGETEYRVAMLPLGGYVRLHGMEREFGEVDPHDETAQRSATSSVVSEATERDESDDPDAGRALQDKAPWMRVLIFSAGPVMNLLLPFALLPPLFYWSTAYDEVVDSSMGSIDEGLPAYRAGLREGDRIISIDQEPVYAFWQIQARVNSFEEGDAPLKVKVDRPTEDAPIDVELIPERVASTERMIKLVRRPPRIGYQPAALAPDYVSSDPRGVFTQAGGQRFDRVLEVGGSPIDQHSEFVAALGAQLAERTATQPDHLGSLLVKVQRSTSLDDRWRFLRHSHVVELSLDLSLLQKRLEELKTLQLDRPSSLIRALGVRQASACVSSINPNSAAAAVLKVGDCLLEVDGSRHSLAVFFDQRLRHQPELPKKLIVLREGAEQPLELALREEVQNDPLAGEVRFWQLGLTLLGQSRLGALLPPESVANQERWSFAWAQTKRRVSDELSRSIHSLTGLFSGEVSPTQLSGPITIFYLAGRQAEAGWEAFIHLMVLISLSIALLNLLPIPGLDGGHIMFAGLEMIARRPLPARLRAHIQMVGVLMILALILFALGNDVMRMWRLSTGG